MEHLPGSLRNVGQGLRLVYIALVLTIALFFVMFVLSFVFMFGGIGAGPAAMPQVGAPGPPAALLRILLFGVSTGYLIVAILDVVGRHMCLSAPAETRARGLILWSMLLSALPIVFSFVGAPLLATLRFPFQVAATLLFLLFLKRMAEFTRDNQLIQRGRSLIRVGVILFAIVGGGVFVVLYRQFMPPAVLGVVPIVSLGVAVTALFWLVSYGKMLVSLRSELMEFAQAISERMEKGNAEEPDLELADEEGGPASL